MPNYQSGPVNLQAGNTASFIVEFLSSGVLTVPSSGTMTVAYTNTSGTAASDDVPLTNVNDFFTGSWSSTSAALGLATWTVISAASTTVAATGQLRILDRQA